MAGIYFPVDAAILVLANPVIRRLAEPWIFDRLRTRVMAQGPYPTPTLFVMPLLILEPAKPFAAYRAARRLDKALFQQLAAGRWIAEHRNLLITGPCGVGKSWLSCALAQRACRDGYTVHYARVPRLLPISNWPTETAASRVCSARLPRPIC